MDRLVKVCDLHSEDTLAVTSLRLVGLGEDRRLDVCDEHLSALQALPAVLSQDGPAAAAPSRAPAASSATDRSEALDRTPSPKPSRARTPAPAGNQLGSRRSLQRERAIVREWARQQGRDIGDKGRLPSGLVEEYRRTQGQASA